MFFFYEMSATGISYSEECVYNVAFDKNINLVIHWDIDWLRTCTYIFFLLAIQAWKYLSF